MAPFSAISGVLRSIRSDSIRSSKIPETEKIFVFAEKNPQPLVATFTFREGTELFFASRIKMGESAKVHVVVRAAGKHYKVSREVKVTIGGCGE